MRAEITKLQRNLTTTTVYVTHDQVEAMTMGNRIAVMNSGKIQQVGTPLDLYDKPANLFVAQFIGTPPMNIVRATIADGGQTIAASKFTLPVPKSLQSLTKGKEGRKIVFGLRPENVLSENETGRGETTKITAEVEIVELLGHEVVVHSRLGDDLLVAKLGAHSIPEVGSKIVLNVELDSLHLFDAETEKRLAA
jgi:multiple sugar transport system ATP-binding protein